MAHAILESPDAVESPIEPRAVLAPWVENPLRLFSWWEMEEFSARQVYALGKLLERVRAEHLHIRNSDDPATDSASNCRLSETRVEGLREFMAAIKEQTKQLGLEAATFFVQDIFTHAHVLTNAEVALQIANLDKLVRWEMGDHLFFFVSPDLAKYYDNPKLLGSSVLEKFPALEHDIVEAGNCYAAGRNTAVVFHLMRVMETGVQELGTKLDVTLVSEKNWQNILDEINKAIKALPKSPMAVKMAQAASNLYSVKLAWRNEVMHPNDNYLQEEAKNLIRLVKIFMEQLAGIV